jgi:hypothetical protein
MANLQRAAYRRAVLFGRQIDRRNKHFVAARAEDFRPVM